MAGRRDSRLRGRAVPHRRRAPPSVRPAAPAALSPFGIVALLVLGIGIVALRDVARDAPALTPALRVADGAGGWRPAPGPAFFDRALYQSERAEAVIQGKQGAADQDRLLASLELAVASVEAAPADAYLWTLLAASAAANGFADAGALALSHARALAPFSGGVALERLALIDLHPTPWSPPLRAAIVQDMRLASAFAPREAAPLIAKWPALAAVDPG